MNLFFLVVIIHFAAGCLAILLLNRKLTIEERKRNWLKFSVYLLIFIIVITSILVNKNLFLACTILILSTSLLEILKLKKLRSENPDRNRAVLLTLIIFSALSLLFSVFVLLPPAIIAFTYTIVIVFDGASQISGLTAGKTKILPVLSPGKTWEGFIGGTLSASITGVILHDFAGLTIIQSVVAGLLISQSAFIGDLAASAYKRAFDTKDFGNILPGQGGVLDRFDSFIASGAVIGLISLITIFSFTGIDKNIFLYLTYSLGYILILLTCELLLILFRMKAEYSRIISHVLAGIASLFLMRLFTSYWYIISLCIQSAIFLFISKKMGLLGSHHQVSRKTNGSSFFFIGIMSACLISVIRNDISLFVLAVAVLTISDPVAALAGLNRKSVCWPKLFSDTPSSKTLIGSLAFFVSTVAVLLAGMSIYSFRTTPYLIIVSLLFSLIVTITEAVSPYGTDNISIPVVVSTGLMLMKAGGVL
jgi:phosphatidate cytidylyltransferase